MALDELLSDGVISAERGSKSLNNPGTKTGNWIALAIPSTATISEVLDEDGTNVTTELIDNASNAVEGYVLLRLSRRRHISSVTFSAGSILAINA